MLNETIPTPETIRQFDKLHKELGEIEDIISDQFSLIFETVCSESGLILNYWYVDGADEGKIGDLSKVIDSNSLNDMLINVADYMIFAFKNSSVAAAEVKLACMIPNSTTQISIIDVLPTEWLFMDKQQILEEFRTARKRYLDYCEEQKAKKSKLAAKKKISKEELSKQIEAKLTPEEVKFLKRNKLK